MKVVGRIEFTDMNDGVEAGLIVRVDTQGVALGAWLKGDGDYTIGLPPSVARKLVELLESALADCRQDPDAPFAKSGSLGENPAFT